MIKKIVSVLILTFLWIPAFAGMTKEVYAADDFATSYDVSYDIEESGITTVTEKITLRNLTSQYYATEFKLTIGATNLSDITAIDGSGQKLETQTDKKDGVTLITVKFNQQVAGLDKQLSWTLQYTSKDFAEKLGKIWEISIPRVSTKAKLDDYKVALAVPLVFGEPTLMTPVPKAQTTSGGKMYLTFDKGQLQGSGISATFGSNQLYDFNLDYHLENTGLIPILTNIALPPDTAYQDVIYQRIEPKPLNVTIDEDGNYLAWYRLNRHQKFTVKVIGSAKLYTRSKIKEPVLSDILRKKYTTSDKYWESDSPEIKEKLNEILKDNLQSTNNEKVKLIYRYVVNLLKYDPSRIADNIERYGAVSALNNPTAAVCMEFTDLFIALTRAAGVPARELDGFAYTVNSSLRPASLRGDVLHAWPEYWDDNRGWVMVDPTWENTTQGVDYFNKLDLNHFTFVVKGFSSGKPIPAGSYKYKDQDSQDVKVTLSDVDFLGKPQINTIIDVSDEVLAGFPSKFKIKVSNQGNAVQPAINFSVFSGKLSILDATNALTDINQNLGAIPAYGYAQFDYNLRTKSFFDAYTDIISVAINNQKFEKQVQVYPFFVFKLFPFLFAAIIFGIAGVYVVILGVMLFRRRVSRNKIKNKNSKIKN